MKKLTTKDIEFLNLEFWGGFVASAFPEALDEETDMSLVEIIRENGLENGSWWDDFTGYYDGIFDESDGYIEDPSTFIYEIAPEKILKVEFHPGDIVYYINDKQIGCLGGEYNIHVFPFSRLLEKKESHLPDSVFLLLLPLAQLEENEVEMATEMIHDILNKIFEPSICGQLTKSIVYGLRGEV